MYTLDHFVSAAPGTVNSHLHCIVNIRSFYDCINCFVFCCFKDADCTVYIVLFEEIHPGRGTSSLELGSRIVFYSERSEAIIGSNREFGLGGGLVGRRRVKLALAGLYLSATALHSVYLRYVKLRLSGPTLTSERRLQLAILGGQGATLNSVFYSDDPLLAALYLCRP